MITAFEVLISCAFAISAALWLISASVKLTKVGRGMEELDRVEHLSNDLQKMGRWNFWAAVATAVAVLLQALSRYL